MQTYYLYDFSFLFKNNCKYDNGIWKLATRRAVEAVNDFSVWEERDDAQTSSASL